jgi:Meiotically up-regulated gene 113
MAGYVYLIGSLRFHWFKIGRSLRPELRIKSLGILLPFKIQLFALWRAESFKYLEKLLHRRYSENRINGEWFYFDDYELRALMLDVPYPFVQYGSLISFTNIIADPEPARHSKLNTPEEREWKRKYGDKWRAVASIESKEERKIASRKLIEEREAHRVDLAKARFSLKEQQK